MGDFDPDLYKINETYYRWCINSYEALKSQLGLNINIHPDSELLHKGHIFLFNHFARFETIIPPYIIYQATGAYSRSVADHPLFTINENLANLMRGVGAMPNNQAGLLPFLAAEILRGKKIVIFPEGGMIKDKNVLHDSGEFGIFSPTDNVFRKHHRGAAVLSLHLDIFKQRILYLHAKGDHARINRWVETLELASPQQLVSRAEEPTLIVPATITFYPIRIEENFLSKSVRFFAKNISPEGMEELLVEGNLILKDTDMDIHLNTPIRTEKKWRWWEKILLNQYFLKVVSLNDLFGLRDVAESRAERLLERCINKHTLIMRDKYMPELYAGITINLSHLAALLILTLKKQHQHQIRRRDFHKILYISLKRLQGLKHLHFHRSLIQPDLYRDLVEGNSVDLGRLVRAGEKAQLLSVKQDVYEFHAKLTEAHDLHQPRLENIIQVYANEVEPVFEVRQIIAQVLQEFPKISAREIAEHLFEDEIRDFTWNKNQYDKPAFHEINARETATKDATPYLLRPDFDSRNGVLLVHGFLASPAELKDFAKKLQRLGYVVMGVRLAGHGTSPWDLKGRNRSEWLDSVRRGYKILAAFVDQISMVGFSAGGALSLLFAAEKPEKLAAVVSVSAPVIYKNKKLIYVPLVDRINKISELLPAYDGIKPFITNDSEHPDINYRHIPVQGLNQLRKLTANVQDNLARIKTPAMIIQGDNDPVVEPASAKAIFNGLTHVAEKSLHWIASDRHGILNENTGDTTRLILEFIDNENRPEESPGKISGKNFGKNSEQDSKQNSGQNHPRHAPSESPTLKPAFRIIEEAVARYPDRPCTNFLGSVQSYADMVDLIDKAARGLQKMNVKKGDRVGICLPNCPYYVVAYFAILKIGAVVVNFNPLYTAEEILYQINDSGTKVMITLDLKSIFPKVAKALDHSALEKIVLCSLSDALPPLKNILFRAFKRSQIANASDDLRVMTYDKLVQQGKAPESVPIDPEHDIAVLQYTGGTTGVPKGAMLTHANVVSNTEQVCLWIGDIDPAGERILCAIPFFHVFAMTAAMNLGLSSGAELVLQPRFVLADVLKAIEAEKITLFPAVPTIFNAINNHPQLNKFDLSSIRFCISGGAALPASVKAGFEAASGCTLVEGYGLTEASPVVCCNPPDGENKPDSIGLPLPWTEVVVLNLDNKKKKLAPYKQGEIALRGPQVMKGYWQNDAATKETIRDGWLLTGDVGYMDEDGYIFLTDRLKDIIICSGFNVYPRVIEDAFYRHPDVDEVIVIGIPDSYRGEQPKAYVKLKYGADLTKQALLEFVGKHLNPIESPSEMEFRDELPKTMIGKLSKKELVEEYQMNAEIQQREIQAQNINNQDTA